jgi:hypothetical protein
MLTELVAPSLIALLLNAGEVKAPILVPEGVGTAKAPVRLECPVKQTTRIVLPGAIKRMKARDQEFAKLFGLTAMTRPVGVIKVTPIQHPAEGELYLEVGTRTLILVLRTVPDGVSSEVRLAFPEQEAPKTGAVASVGSNAGEKVSNGKADGAPHVALTPAPGPMHGGGTRTSEPTLSSSSSPAPRQPGEREVAPKPSPPVAVPPTPSPVPKATPSPTAPPSASPSPPPEGQKPVPLATPAAEPASKAEGWQMRLAQAVVNGAPSVPIGRKAGLPGQKAMVLEDVLKGDQYLWCRFTLKGGSKAHVERVSTEWGDLENYSVTPVGQDLKIVVELPRVKTTKKTAITIVAEGPPYKFPALASPTLGNTLKGWLGLD